MKSTILSTVLLLLIFSSASSCKQESSCHDEMILILQRFDQEPYSHLNQWYPQIKITSMDSLVIVTQNIPGESKFCKCLKADMLMKLGQKEEAIKVLEGVPKDDAIEIIQKEDPWKNPDDQS
jgi:hypothetical protein